MRVRPFIQQIRVTIFLWFLLDDLRLLLNDRWLLLFGLSLLLFCHLGVLVPFFFDIGDLQMLVHRSF
jgi:hypothetical protein